MYVKEDLCYLLFYCLEIFVFDVEKAGEVSVVVERTSAHGRGSRGNETMTAHAIRRRPKPHLSCIDSDVTTWATWESNFDYQIPLMPEMIESSPEQHKMSIFLLRSIWLIIRCY